MRRISRCGSVNRGGGILNLNSSSQPASAQLAVATTQSRTMSFLYREAGRVLQGVEDGKASLKTLTLGRANSVGGGKGGDENGPKRKVRLLYQTIFLLFAPRSFELSKSASLACSFLGCQRGVACIYCSTKGMLFVSGNWLRRCFWTTEREHFLLCRCRKTQRKPDSPVNSAPALTSHIPNFHRRNAPNNYHASSRGVERRCVS